MTTALSPEVILSKRNPNPAFLGQSRGFFLVSNFLVLAGLTF